MLTRRWRENDARENLSPFEQLLAIGEMFDTTAARAQDASPPTAAVFGELIGVSESVISRARAVSARREAIIAAVDDPYALSNTKLYRLLPTLGKAKPSAGSALGVSDTAPSYGTNRRAGAVRLNARLENGALTIRARGMPAHFDAKACSRVLDTVLKKLAEEAKSGPE